MMARSSFALLQLWQVGDPAQRDGEKLMGFDIESRDQYFNTVGTYTSNQEYSTFLIISSQKN